MSLKGGSSTVLGILAAISFSGFWVIAEAETLFVAGNGIDDAFCGSPNHPCRSISQALVYAGLHDTIIVGPGHYGDANHDGLGGPGDERAEDGSGCDCLIKIDKPITIESSDGPATTVIENPLSHPLPSFLVGITSPDVVFGGPGRGFTLSMRRRNGINVTAPHSVTVAGQVATGGGVACIAEGANHTFLRNLVIGSAIGFMISGTEHKIISNVVTANDSSGIRVQGTGHQLIGNVSTANAAHGLEVVGTGHLVKRGAFLGNNGAGVLAVGSDLTITESNVFGNNYNLGNCGVYYSSENQGVLDARRNFWGNQDGPGPDPADRVCGPGPIITDPPSMVEFQIQPLPAF